MANTLNKTERLKSRKQIEILFKEGMRLNVSLLKVFYVLRSEEAATTPRLQFGVGVSSRFFKHAVDRNRIKRLGREAWRVQKHTLQELLEQQGRQMNVFFIYTGKELPDYQAMYTAVADAVKKLMIRLK